MRHFDRRTFHAKARRRKGGQTKKAFYDFIFGLACLLFLASLRLCVKKFPKIAALHIYAHSNIIREIEVFIFGTPGSLYIIISVGRKIHRMPSSEKPSIQVVGSESLDNSYLGVSLELDGFKVSYLDFQDFVATSPENHQNHFYLIDYQCDKTIGKLEILAQAKSSTPPLYALFNICPGHIDQKKMLELIRLGLAGIFFDGENLEMICRGVRMILEGEHWFPRKLLLQMLLENNEYTKPVGGQKSLAGLTCREKEVLVKLCSGSSNQEISELLFISLSTVKMHTSSIYEKIGVTSRLQAVLWMAKNG